MIHFNSANEMTNAVVNIMEDIWRSRRHMKDQTYFVFRLEASNFDEDVDLNVFVHYLVTKDFWYAKVSNEEFDVTRAELTASASTEELFSKSQVQSWRHYAFGDLVYPLVNEFLKAAPEKVNQYTIWDTFPARDF